MEDQWGLVERADGSVARGARGDSGVDAGEAGGSSPRVVSDAEREKYLQLALEAFESRSLDAYEYTWRVRAIERATSVAEMVNALERHVRYVPASRGEPSRPAYDAVDLARTTARPGGARRSRTTSRYPALILVLLVLVVLLGLGVWLATRVHSLNSDMRGAVVGPASVEAYASTPGIHSAAPGVCGAARGTYISAPGAPPLPLSPCK
ncbi:MAG: hypothetical protein ABSC00_01775 [Acidimicrobiales bacterium]